MVTPRPAPGTIVAAVAAVVAKPLHPLLNTLLPHEIVPPQTPFTSPAAPLPQGFLPRDVCVTLCTTERDGVECTARAEFQ